MRRVDFEDNTVQGNYAREDGAGASLLLPPPNVVHAPFPLLILWRAFLAISDTMDDRDERQQVEDLRAILKRAERIPNKNSTVVGGFSQRSASETKRKSVSVKMH